MSYPEKKSLTVIATTLATCAAYFGIVANRYSERSDSFDALTFWSGVILLSIPVLVAAHVVTQVVLIVAHKHATGEEPPEVLDERDKLIELKTLRVSHFSLLAGIFASMLVAWRGGELTAVFIGIAASLLISGTLGDVARYALYRKDT